ncbi:uncharacterized protein LOC111680139 [Lucilia cuprina]|uniref:uncharacterized protein LOC111680139 n=1 Tax=Lucilia cuprina TaxID=7375 RepID=UPI001F05D492|nr:uncharacterized protein LOC111680139 [Lucilia cuprina]
MYLQKFNVLLITFYLNCYQVLSLDANNYNQILTQLTNSLANSDPSSSSCFKNHLATSKNISDKFEKSRETCTTVAKISYEKADKAYILQQRILQRMTQNSCNAIKKCKIKKRGSKSLDCYVLQGFESAKRFSKISMDANTCLNYLKKDYSNIDDEQESCNSKAQRVFEDETVEAGQALKKCLKGNKS